ncbi:MAG: hypothetical protein JWM56_1026 [Candidatus Peribacteria bacterium]|nr:hypothetical protein [Candidatus Peribacteria bacterium]
MEPAGKKTFRRMVTVVVAIVALYVLGKGTLALFGLIGGGHEQGVNLRVEAGSSVDIALGGKDFIAAEDNTSLQPGDAVRTSAKSHAVLSFADGTIMRMDEQTSMSVLKSEGTTDKSTISAELLEGNAWVSTPAASQSGTRLRIIDAPSLSFDLPKNTEALLTPRSVVVYSADGAGVTVTPKNTSAHLAIGEGQQFVFPVDAAATANLEQYRTAFTLSAFRNAFVNDSRLKIKGIASTSGSMPTDSTSALTLTSPTDGQNIATASVHVAGTIDPATVTTVRINGRTITTASGGSFQNDVTLPGNTAYDIHVEGLNADGILVAETTRTVRHQQSDAAAATGFASPAITSPAAAAETFRTTDSEVVIRGSAPAGTAKIMVNDYILKLFDPAKGSWSYLARLDLGNMKAGENIYDVVSIDANGNRSTPARLTVVQGVSGGVTATPVTQGSSSSIATKPQNNAPTAAGTLSITGPTAGTSHTETGTGFLLEGTTSASTDSMWVNDYRLQLYKSGVKYWNYIASAAFGNLKKGTNTYTIVARDKNGKVLDKMVYTVTY